MFTKSDSGREKTNTKIVIVIESHFVEFLQATPCFASLNIHGRPSNCHVNTFPIYPARNPIGLYFLVRISEIELRMVFVVTRRSASLRLFYPYSLRGDRVSCSEAKPLRERYTPNIAVSSSLRSVKRVQNALAALLSGAVA